MELLFIYNPLSQQNHNPQEKKKKRRLCQSIYRATFDMSTAFHKIYMF